MHRPSRFLAAGSIFLVTSVARAVPPTQTQVDNLCLLVAEENGETDPSAGTDKAYKTLLFRLAGVDPHRDSAEVTGEKVRAWWSANQAHVKCNVVHSVVRNGSLLKLAADRSSTEFINNAVRRWKIDLNAVDADGTTVLDWLVAQRAANADSPRYDILNRYVTIFTSNGAKHASEL